MPANLLLIDDQPDVLEGLRLAFGRTDNNVLTAANGEEAIHILNSDDVDVVVTDLRMDGIDGLGVLRHALTLNPAPAVIILTAHGTIESAVDALKEGAFDYLTKPVNVKELRVLVEKAAEHRRLLRENFELRQQIDRRFGIEGMVGDSAEMQQLYQMIRQVGPTKATVLVQGESGTGKELVARALHQMSPRARKDFIPVHCAALPETLLESELFGHERGAFTGAVSRRPGRFEVANNGTLFLDEIGEIPLSMQVKLLRVLEQREIQRVGGNETIKVDVRLIVATNRDLEEEVAEGRFREDLYYRLKVVQIVAPPLRHRRSDIPVLAQHFLAEFARENGRSVPTLSRDAVEALQAYHWPGNVRELRNIMENTFVFLQGDTVGARDLPGAVKSEKTAPSDTLAIPMGLPLEEVETLYLKRTLAAVDGNRTRAAEALGISRRTLQRRIKELGIEG
ncbi:MAG: sigma-54-dependent Fis family transcriptional regulator [Candidatus Sumerlaeia bacterium]|nr:sigma-54-dependent Fis family transcriptional regulator [Candidatus Sumerlaeia bacterium]